MTDLVDDRHVQHVSRRRDTLDAPQMCSLDESADATLSRLLADAVGCRVIIQHGWGFTGLRAVFSCWRSAASRFSAEPYHAHSPRAAHRAQVRAQAGRGSESSAARTLVDDGLRALRV